MSTVLRVDNLKVAFKDEENQQVNEVVHGVSFSLEKGKVLALVGESGSGKSVTAMALIKLLPSNSSQIMGNKISYYQDSHSESEIDLLQACPEDLQSIRGKEVAVIFQDPMLALNPVQRVGKQVSEVFELHRPDISPKDYESEVIGLFDKVGIDNPSEKVRSYPHQISGGMRQRVMIAIALAGRPKILIADEPTTSLDVTIQAQILSLLQDLQEEYGMTMLFISHDLAVVRALSDKIAVMYKGNIVEINDSETLINQPQHEYTQSLLAASRLVRE